MIPVKKLHPGVSMDNIGMIPHWLSESDPRSASLQLDNCYGHGGGWNSFPGFKLREDNSLKYPGDPPLLPIAELRLRDELILIYEYSWVAIVQSNRTFEVCRMD